VYCAQIIECIKIFIGQFLCVSDWLLGDENWYGTCHEKQPVSAAILLLCSHLTLQAVSEFHGST
jgi:hypothetical protein